MALSTQYALYLVDESRYPEGKAGSISGLIFRLENARSPKEFKAALEEMTQNMPSYLDSVKRAVAVWITYVLAPKSNWGRSKIESNHQPHEYKELLKVIVVW